MANLFPDKPALRLPRNKREYRRLVKRLDTLVDEVGENESHPLASMMNMIGMFIEKYEDGQIAELA
jgi:HTH-type transcriptional regulator/antitoxin HigA